MQLNGRIYKDGKFWVVECAALEAGTQGTTKADGLEMMKDLVRTMLDDPAFDFEIQATGKDTFTMTFADPRRILGLIVARRRGMTGMTLQEVGESLGSKSRSVISQAESGKSELGISRLSEILGAFGLDVVIDIVQRNPPLSLSDAKRQKAGDRLRTSVGRLQATLETMGGSAASSRSKSRKRTA